MIFIFWQNIVSIHQSAFIKALSKEHDVTLVVSETIDEQRRQEKWSVPSMGDARVVVAPDQAMIDSLLDSEGVHHVFSGINAFPMIFTAFKGAVKRGLKVSVMAEPYEWAGIRGIMRRVMYSLLFLRYGRSISHFFTTGNMGIECYRKAGFPAQRLHQWGYFTEQGEFAAETSRPRDLPNLIFIGKIDERKNILPLAQSAVRQNKRFSKMTIIGTGPLESELREIIADTPNIEFIGAIPNNEIAAYLAVSDLLVLPSQFDGWGAVINEALAQGTRVLCSNRCGAETLLDNDSRGGVFLLDKENDLETQLIHWLDKGPLSDDERVEIRHWAKNCISGNSASAYFCSIMAEGHNAEGACPPPSAKQMAVNLIYVGRIDANKNILEVLKGFEKFGDNVNRFTIVGDGPLMEELKVVAESNSRIELLGRLDNDGVRKIMATHDYLILPSLYDGWGSVVNEALSVGTAVLCSEACGASILLDGAERGQVFTSATMFDILKKNCDRGPVSVKRRRAIASWASRTISGTAAANYFVAAINGLAPKAPWLN